MKLTYHELRDAMTSGRKFESTVIGGNGKWYPVTNASTANHPDHEIREVFSKHHDSFTFQCQVLVPSYDFARLICEAIGQDHRPHFTIAPYSNHPVEWRLQVSTSDITILSIFVHSITTMIEIPNLSKEVMDTFLNSIKHQILPA